MNLDTCKNVLFKSFRSWFFELATLAEQVDDSSRLPRLELLLRSGHVIRGSIVTLHEHANEQLMMILSVPDAYTKSEITLVSSSEVVALTLLEPENYVQRLSAASDPKAVGTLELRRAIKNIEAELAKILHYTVTLQLAVDEFPEHTRWDVLRTVGFLPSVFASVAVDELGKKQVREHIKTICIQVADTNAIALNQQTLLLKIASPLTIPVAKEKERLQQEIEQFL